MLTRLYRYLLAMCPPHLMVPASLITFYAFYGSVQAMAGPSPVAVTRDGLIAAFTLVGFMFLMRVYDDLKDMETDIALGQAGDPAYRDRPTVTGQVERRDLTAWRWILTVSMLGANLALTSWWTLLVFAGVFACFWLSFHWYFYPAMEKNLLLAFVTHNPLQVISELYIVAVVAGDHLLGHCTAVDLVWLHLGMWMPVAAWEVARKVRAPQDETAYTTYSRVLGTRRAAVLPLLFAGVSAVSMWQVARAAGFPEWYGGLLVVALVPLGIGSGTRRVATLRPATELYGLLLVLATTLALATSHGIAWI